MNEEFNSDAAGKLKIPDSAADAPKNINDEKEAYIINPAAGKDMLTKIEAIDIINHLSGVLLVDGRYRSTEKHKVYLQQEGSGPLRPGP